MRRFGGRVLAVVALAACGGSKDRPLESLYLQTDDAISGTPLQRIEGPTRWTADDGSLCLDIPEGWSGFLHDEGALLALRHDSGVGLKVRRGPGTEIRDGFVKVFESAGTWRVPVLFPAATATWASELPGGPTIQEWSGLLDGELVRIEVSYPWGEAVWGRQLADVLLGGLCRP